MSQNDYKPHKAAVKGIGGMLKAVLKPKKQPKEKK